MDLYGNIVGVIGGNLLAVSSRYRNVGLLSANAKSGAVTVTPINEKMLQVDLPPMTIKSMLDSGILTPPLSETPVLVYAGSTNSIPTSLYMPAKTQYSRKETVYIYANWQQKEDIRKGFASLKVFDINNKVSWEEKPQSLKLFPNKPTPFISKFNAGILGTGIFRIDIYWNDLPVWRSFIFITD